VGCEASTLLLVLQFGSRLAVVPLSFGLVTDAWRVPNTLFSHGNLAKSPGNCLTVFYRLSLMWPTVLVFEYRVTSGKGPTWNQDRYDLGINHSHQ